MLKIVCILLAVVIIVLSTAFIWKQHAQKILWSVAILLLTSMLLLIGFGVINPENGFNGDLILGLILVFFTAGALIMAADRLKKQEAEKKRKQEVQLPASLDTDYARKIFAKAIEAGLITLRDGSYKWNESKVMLSYLCGRLYCGDKPHYDKVANETEWVLGEKVFPDKEIGALFGLSQVGQSRLNRGALKAPKNHKIIDKLFE